MLRAGIGIDTPALGGLGPATVAATYATLNGSDKDAGITLSNGNLDALDATNNGAWRSVRANQSHTTGKWCFGFKLTSAGSNRRICGMGTAAMALNNYVASNTLDSFAFNDHTTVRKVQNGSFNDIAALSQPLNNDCIAVAADIAGGKAWAGTYVSGVLTWDGDPVAGTGATITFAAGADLYPAIGLVNGASARLLADPALIPFAIPAGFNAGFYT